MLHVTISRDKDMSRNIAKKTHSRLLTKKRAAVRKRVQKSRASLKKRGLRLIQIWVPDTRSKKFRAECRRQSLLAANSPHEKEIMDWIEAVSDYDGWEA